MDVVININSVHTNIAITVDEPEDINGATVEDIRALLNKAIASTKAALTERYAQ